MTERNEAPVVASSDGERVAEWLDISLPLRPGMVHWPGQPELELTRLQDLDHGQPANVSRLSMSVHAGTHLDAPRHLLPGGATSEAIPLDAVIGPARVLEIADPVCVGATELEHHRLQRGDRILLRTRNSPRLFQSGGHFLDDYVSLSPEAAELLVERGVRLVGLDALSVAEMGEAGARTHRTLLGGGVWVLEGLDLTGVAPGDYELICLPLRLVGADGVPARAILGPRQLRLRR